MRYTGDGRLDPSFGDGGMTGTAFVGASDYAVGVSLLPGDGLLVAGAALEPIDGGKLLDIGVARYTADGQLDPTLAPGGKLVTPFSDSPYVDSINVQALQPDGKLVVGGYTERSADGGGHVQTLTLARYSCQ